MMGSIFDTAAQQSTAFAQQGIDAQLNKKQREWMERREDLQYQRGWDVMNYQNWYNSPEMQMNRFRQAGLNPHLIYGQGTPGNTQSTPQMGNRGKYNNQVRGMASPEVFAKAVAFNQALENIGKIQEEKKYIDQMRSYTKQKQANAFLESQEKRWNILSKMNQALHSSTYYGEQAKQMQAKTINEAYKYTLLQTNAAVNTARENLLKEQKEMLPYSGSWYNMIMRLWDSGSRKRNGQSLGEYMNEY